MGVSKVRDEAEITFELQLMRDIMHYPRTENLTGDKAIDRLMAGNRRYVTAKQIHPNQMPERRAELIDGQRPFAVILGCADSRVPPEIIFDQGLGDLFVVRVAGNVVSEVVMESIEYAATHLHTPLVMVLGHSQCGAITATVASDKSEENQSTLYTILRPSVDKARRRPGNLVNNAAKINAKMASRNLERNGSVFSDLVNTHKLKIVAAYYHLETGVVEILS